MSMTRKPLIKGPFAGFVPEGPYSTRDPKEIAKLLALVP